MVKNRKILILGGEGFIGRNLSDVLSADFDCYSLDHRKSLFPGSKTHFLNIDPYNKRIKDHYDVVIVLIDNPVPLEEVEKTEQGILTNLDLISPEQIIVFSSASTYVLPNSEYAKRKLLIEEIYKKYAKNRKVGLSILRLFNIFGPYQIPDRKGSLVANLFFKYYAKESVEINDFSAERDLIYSPDMAQCVKEVIRKKLFGTDDLATNEMTTIEELVVKINQFIPDKIKIINKNIKEKETSPSASSHIVKRIKLTPMAQSLKKTADFYQENWRIIKEKTGRC
mgnify:CR=1 FL=1